MAVVAVRFSSIITLIKHIYSNCDGILIDIKTLNIFSESLNFSLSPHIYKWYIR